MPLGGLLNNSNASGDSERFNLLAGLVSRNPTPPEPPQQTAVAKPERRLGRRTYSVLPASVTGATAGPFDSSDDANFSGGVLRRFAALAGIDPNQSAPPPDDEQDLADLQALKARLLGSGNINDAVALYQARKASRR